MRYRTLGGTGIQVSVHCLGAMMFGAVGNPDRHDGVRIIHAALDQGINFVDTADMYSAGESEQIVGQALQGRRDDVVLATKVHFPMGEGPNHSGNSRRWILTAVEHSLQRLQTDWIDLYQVHRPDHTTDIEETLGVLVWSPLASGVLSGRYRKGRPVDLSAGRAKLNPERFDPAVPGNAAKLQAVEQLAELAGDVGCSLPQLAVAFTVAHPAVTSVIIGPRTMDHLDGLLQGASLILDDATLDRIDQIVPPGTNLYHPDGAWRPVALSDAARRRRPLADRAAA